VVDKNNISSERNKKRGKGKVSTLLSLLMIFVYAVIYFADNKLFIESANTLWKMILQFAPYLFLIFLLMFLSELLITPEKAKKIFGNKSGIKALAVTSVVGILSVGPVYVWFPLLHDLKRHGITNKLITVFMYNRAVKLQIFPVMVFYFGLKFTIVFTIMLIIFSFFVGEIVGRLTPEEIKGAKPGQASTNTKENNF